MTESTHSDTVPVSTPRFERVWDSTRDCKTVIDFALKSSLYEEVRDISAGAYHVWQGLIELEKILFKVINNPQSQDTWLSAESLIRKWRDLFQSNTSTLIFRCIDQRNGNALIELANPLTGVAGSYDYHFGKTFPAATTTATRVLARLSWGIAGVLSSDIFPLLRNSKPFRLSRDLDEQRNWVDAYKACLSAFHDWTGESLSRLGSLILAERKQATTYLIQNQWLIKAELPSPCLPEEPPATSSLGDLITIEEVANKTGLEKGSLSIYVKRWGDPERKNTKGRPKLFSYSKIRPQLIKDWPHVRWPDRWIDNASDDI